MGSCKNIEDDENGFKPRITRKGAIIFVVIFVVLSITTYLDSLPR